MAFLSKFGSVLKQTASKQISTQVFASRPSFYQATRCMSSSKLFVGGIPYNTDEYSLREAFDKYGAVLEARIIVDRETGRSRGFGFVTFSSSEEASSALQALDGQDLHGRRIRVNYATDRGSGFGGRGFGGGYGAPAGNYGSSPPYGGSNSTAGSGYGGGNAYGGSDGGYGGGNTYGSGGGDYGVAGGSDSYAESGVGESGSTNDQFGDINEFGNMEGGDKDDGQDRLDGDDDTTDAAKRA